MSKSFEIEQKTDFSMVCESQTVDWLVENTIPNKFRIENGIVLGYQREIKASHVEKIIKYIKECCAKNSFYFPSNIVCSIPQNTQLLQKNGKQYFIVDGQHRIKAFKVIKDELPELYAKIRDCELPITKLVNVDEPTEISTFITINKTSRKVDTSLAFALKKKLVESGEKTDISKIDYISVILAQNVNEDEDSPWHNQISFEGILKKDDTLLSLNAFVKAIRRIVRALEKRGVINLAPNNDTDLEPALDKTKLILYHIWNRIENKWKDLFENKSEKSVILGPIGFTTICKYIAFQITNESLSPDIMNDIEKFISRIKYNSDVWVTPDGEFTKYSSESGYSVIATKLVESYRKT